MNLNQGFKENSKKDLVEVWKTFMLTLDILK